MIQATEKLALVVGHQLDAETLDRLDSEILSQLRATAKTRKDHWLREGSETGCIFEQVSTAYEIAKARDIGRRGQSSFVWKLVKSRIPHLVATGAIRKQPRITSTGRAIPGYSVPMLDASLTAWDRRFLAAICVAWDAEPAASIGGRGAAE